MFGSSLIHDVSKHSIDKKKGIEECTPGTSSYILVPVDPTRYFVTFCTTSDIKLGWNKAILYILMLWP